MCLETRFKPEVEKMMKHFRLSFLVCCFLFCTALLYAHSGGTDSKGGHYNRRTGSYHYHGSGSRIGRVSIGRSWRQIAVGASRSTQAEAPQQAKPSTYGKVTWTKSSMRTSDGNKRAWSRMVANIQARAAQGNEYKPFTYDKVTSLDVKQTKPMTYAFVRMMFPLIWLFCVAM